MCRQVSNFGLAPSDQRRQSQTRRFDVRSDIAATSKARAGERHYGYAGPCNPPQLISVQHPVGWADAARKLTLTVEISCEQRPYRGGSDAGHGNPRNYDSNYEHPHPLRGTKGRPIAEPVGISTR
jgi:hypothetical protein